MCVIGAGELGECLNIEQRSRDWCEPPGTRVASVGKALGMKVILAERKGVSQNSVRSGRVYFEDALKSATVFIMTLPLEPSTRDLISAKELA